MSGSTSALEALGETARERLERREQPEWTDPMLATLADEAFSAEVVRERPDPEAGT